MNITSYRSVNKDNLIAYFSLYVEKWGIYLNNCSLIRGRNGGTFIGFPSQKYEKDGETKYAPHFCFDKEVNERFQLAAKKAIDEYVKTNQEQPKQEYQPNLDENDECPF